MQKRAATVGNTWGQAQVCMRGYHAPQATDGTTAVIIWCTADTSQKARRSMRTWKATRHRLQIVRQAGRSGAHALSVPRLHAGLQLQTPLRNGGWQAASDRTSRAPAPVLAPSKQMSSAPNEGALDDVCLVSQQLLPVRHAPAFRPSPASALT